MKISPEVDRSDVSREPVSALGTREISELVEWSQQQSLRIPVDSDDGRTESDRAVVQIRSEQTRRRQAEAERDALADRIAQDFEELHWLRCLAATLSASDATTDLTTVATAVLPDLRTLIRAEEVFLSSSCCKILSAAQCECRQTSDSAKSCCGQEAIPESEYADLVRQCREQSPERPVVFNRGSSLAATELKTTARNVIAVPLLQSRERYGWLIALNKAVDASSGSERPPSDFLSPEFGSHEVGLMSTAAGMLAGHARNLDLFHAEQSLRVDVIETIAGAIDARDPYTCGHSRRVAQMATRIAAQLHFTHDEQQEVYVTGLMHDVGKIGIPDEILKKPDRLTDEEFQIIQQHPEIGHTILSPLKRLSFVLPGVLHHHERIDGRGYPHGLVSEEIPITAKILAVADSYDAMTSNRAYRAGMPHAKAIGILKECSGTQWDPTVVGAFLEASAWNATDSPE